MRLSIAGLVVLVACQGIRPQGTFSMTHTRLPGGTCPEETVEEKGSAEILEIDLTNTLRITGAAPCPLVESNGGNTLTGQCPTTGAGQSVVTSWSLTFDLTGFQGTKSEVRSGKGSCHVEYGVRGAPRP